MKMRGRLNRTMSVTEPNSVHSSGLSNTLPSGKNISKQGTYNNTSSNTNKENVSGNVRMFQHDTLPQETYFHHNISSSSVNLGEDVLHNSKLNKSGGTGEVGTMTTGGSGGNNDGPSSKLGSIAMSSSTLPMSLSSLQQNVRTLPLPKLGLSSPWFNAGIKFCGNRRISHIFNLLWGLVYSICGAIQFIAGIYFMLDLPIFQLGSNIWTGAWNLFSGILIILLCSTGQLSNLKAQGILLLSLVVTVVNLVNLVILEVGEWRGFLSQTDKDFIEENGFEDHMYTAYLCTTISTVLAMITSFLASQHTFCYLQLQAEKAKAVKNMNFDEADNETILAKDLVNRQDDGLNLKTPAGPQPHPSWVYRHNYAQFNPQQQHQHPNAGGNFVSRRDSISTGANPAAIVKRSLSLLNRTRATKSEGRAAAGNNTNGNHHQATTDRLELLSKQLNGTGGNRGGVPTLSEAVDSSAGGNGMRTAVIRRHQSMYIHPRATENLTPAAFASSQPYKLHEVSGQSEVRPIVTLKRSHTTVGQTSGSANLLYHSSTLQKNQQQKTFRAASKLQALRQQHLQQQRDPNQSHASRYVDHNQNNMKGYDARKRRRKSLSPSAYFSHQQQQQQQHHHHSNTLTHHRERGMTVDGICEFQAGRSFDLPDPERFRRVNATGWGLDNNTPSKLGCVIFDSDGLSNTLKRTAIRHAQDEMSTDSCGENIRYQAVEGLVHLDNRPKRQLSFLKQQSHYSSLENLLIDEKQAAENALNLANGGGLNTVTDLRRNNGETLNGMVRYNSTGSIDSLGSAAVPVHQTFPTNIQQQYQQYNTSTLHSNNSVSNITSNMGSSNTLSRFSKNQTPTSLYSQDNDSSRNFSSTSGLDISAESQVIEMEMDMIMELHNQRKSKSRKHQHGILTNKINELDIYDGRSSLSKRGPVTVRKSNSRVSSTGKLRLRVESFRNTTTSNGDTANKNSSGTQTDISVLKQRGQDMTIHSSPKIGQDVTEIIPTHHAELQNHSQGKYTGQYKKHTAPPNKPARKSKPSPNGNSNGSSNHQRRPSNTSDNGSSNGGIGSNMSAATSENRSDRSTSPDNSSTSGYSSPSAGVHSKESSPCGSKIPSPPQSMEDSEANITLEEPMPIVNKEESEVSTEEEHSQSMDSETMNSNEYDKRNHVEEQKEQEDKSKITVIQIVPTTKNVERDTNNTRSEHDLEENQYRQNNYTNEEDISRDVPASIPPPKMFHYHRELPRIATNGTLSRSNPQQQSQQQQQPLFQPQYQGKRKLPDRTKLPPPPPDPLNVPRTSNNNSQSGIGISSSNSSSTTTHSSPSNTGSSNSNNNRPLPSSSLGSSSNSSAASNNGQRLFRSNLPRPAPIHNYGQGVRSVPLPPVPELDRSDHERESMSPIPESPRQHQARHDNPLNLQNNNHLHYNQSNGNSNRYQPQHLGKLRQLPSPLTTPIQPAEKIIQPRPRRFGGANVSERELPQIPTQQNPGMSRIPRATTSSSSPHQTLRDPKTSSNIPTFNERSSASKSRESSRSPERYRGDLKRFQPQPLKSNNASREPTYTSTLDHQPRRNNGGGSGANKSSNDNTGNDESHVEERLRALIAMLGTTQTQTNAKNEKDSGVGEDHWHNQEEEGSKSTKTNLDAPNRGMGIGNLEPLIGGKLPTDEQGTLQYLSQLESVARRLKDQLLQDQQKSTLNSGNGNGSRITTDFDRADVKESEC